MLNERAVRQQLGEVRKALQALEPQRAVLQALEESLTNWLDLNASPGEQLPLATVKSNGEVKRPKGKVLGAISLADAMIRTLRNRAGNPMHVESLVEAARAMGAVTNSSKPAKVADWTLYDIVKKGRAPLKKVAPLTWVYEEAD